MPIKQLDNLIRQVVHASRVQSVDRRCGADRRQVRDRRSLRREAPGLERRGRKDRRLEGDQGLVSH